MTDPTMTPAATAVDSSPYETLGPPGLDGGEGVGGPGDGGGEGPGGPGGGGGEGPGGPGDGPGPSGQASDKNPSLM